MANQIYVLSDLHGSFQILKEMLKKIEFSSSDTLYILGDCCDRGPKSLEIYFYIQQHSNIILIKGNHEIMMRDTFKAEDVHASISRLWAQNGGLKTYRSYHRYLHKNAFDEYNYKVLRAAFYAMMIKFVDSCPNYVEVSVHGRDFVLIHAGINPEKSLYDQEEDECAWIREWFFLSKGIEGKTIIFGHTPTHYLYHEKRNDIWYDPVFHDKIGIDGGLGNLNEGQLNCLCLNTMEVFVVTKQEAPDQEEEDNEFAY